MLCRIAYIVNINICLYHCFILYCIYGTINLQALSFLFCFSVPIFWISIGTFLSVSLFSAYLLDINRHFSLCFAFQCLPFGSAVGTFLSVLLFGAYLLEISRHFSFCFAFRCLPFGNQQALSFLFCFSVPTYLNTVGTCLIGYSHYKEARNIKKPQVFNTLGAFSYFCCNRLIFYSITIAFFLSAFICFR